MTERNTDAPKAFVLGPEDGESLWQPLPSRGYVTLKLTPENMPYDHFSVGTQLLPPGCQIREHGHLQNHELVFVQEGTGTVTIDGVTHPLAAGSTVLFGRNARHWIENTGTTDLKLFWVFMPPGLEDWMRAIGRPRTAGDPMPPPFQRPEDVAEVQRRLKFMPPRAG
jgi:mannose-6-phosphate isomerase-like protein (cupin superfamily)